MTIERTIFARITAAVITAAFLIGLANRAAIAQPATGPDSKATSQPAAPTREEIQQYVKLNGDLLKLLEAKDWAGAADICRKMAELVPQSPDPHYNLACCLARLGKNEQALDELAKAAEFGYSDAAHARQDEDLASFKGNKRFEEFLVKARANEVRMYNRVYEKGEPIAGVETVEGDPEGGLRWRLRMSPTATKEKPNRLIVWLHPSSRSSGNELVEPISPKLNEQGFALLVLTAKNWAGWSQQDMTRLTERVLPDVAKVPGIDANRPILFGFSAGGQAALVLWAHSPEKFGGLVLDAAYPFRIDAAGKLSAAGPPKNPAAKTCPIFVLVGGTDGGSRIWSAVEEPYRDAGIPLTIYVIKGHGHEWLFGGAQRDKLYRWLGQVAEGKNPGAATEPDEKSTTQPGGPGGPLKIQDIY